MRVQTTLLSSLLSWKSSLTTSPLLLATSVIYVALAVTHCQRLRKVKQRGGPKLTMWAIVLISYLIALTI